MKIALFSRSTRLYRILIAAGLILCVGLAPIQAQQATSTPLPPPLPTNTLPPLPPTNTIVPCLLPSVEVTQDSVDLSSVWLKIKNTSASTTAYLNGFSIQWADTQRPLRLLTVSLITSSQLWTGSGRSLPPITANTTSPNWSGTHPVPAGGTAYMMFRFLTTIGAGPNLRNAFSGTLTFSCDTQGTNSITAVFGTPPLTPTPTPITPTVTQDITVTLPPTSTWTATPPTVVPPTATLPVITLSTAEPPTVTLPPITLETSTATPEG